MFKSPEPYIFVRNVDVLIYVHGMCNVSSIVKSILFVDDTNLFLVGDDLTDVCELCHLNWIN